MSLQELCRLCLSKDNLLWVFDKRLERTDHMKDVILITTGVEIHSKDVISQKICTKCGQDAIKMFQFRQQSLKNDRYLKAQCRDLLKHKDLKIPNTNVTIKTEKTEKEEIKPEARPKPTYKVHPTMTALSRKYPQMQFPSICLLSNIDPCISMEMDTVENYFKSRNLNMRKYVQIALRAGDKNISGKPPTATKCSEKLAGSSTKNTITDHVSHTSTAISKTVGSVEVVHKVSPINIKLNQSGYTIVRPSTADSIHGKVKNVCESSSSWCERLATDSPEFQLGISESKKRRLSANDLLSEPQTKKAQNVNFPNMTIVQPIVEKKSPSVFKCNICSSVQFSAKHLKKHQIRHSRCKYCKIQFKSVGMKRQHIIHSCLVKEALSSVTNVEVERVELNRNVRLHYQNAFTIFPPLPGMEEIDSTSKSTDTAVEIIEIISDDEGASVSPTKPICSTKTVPTTSAVSTTFHRNPQRSTVIIPDVRIKNDNILNSLKSGASELEIMKELLLKFRELQSVTESTQTVLPTTDLIQVNEKNLTADLKNLKQVLYSYKIPVKIQKGSLNASYNYQSTPPRLKKLSLWKDLTPIHFETEKNLSNNQIPNSEHVITQSLDTSSNNITNNIHSIHISTSCDSFNRDQSSLHNIGIGIPASSNCFTSSSDSPQTKSSIVSSQTESRIPTPESFNIQTQNGQILPDSFHSNPTSLEIFPVQTTSSIGDIPIRRHLPTSFGTNQTTPHINSHSLEKHPVQTTSSIANILNGRNSSGADQTTSQSSVYINSAPRRKSPGLKKTDVNGNLNSLNNQSEPMDCSVITKQHLTNKAIEYVFNNCTECVNTGTTKTLPSNGLIYSNNKQPSLLIRYNKPKSMMSKRHSDFTKKNSNFHNVNVLPTTDSSIGNQKLHGNKAPVQRIESSDNVFIKPPPPYPNGSTPVIQTTQSYISSHSNSGNVHLADKTLRTSGYCNAYNRYIVQRQEFSKRSPTVRASGTYTPKAMLDSVAPGGKIGYFPASNLLRNSVDNRSILKSPRITEPSYCHGIESSVTFPHYYNKTSNYVNASSVNPVKQNCDVSNRLLPITTCRTSSTPAPCDTLTDSVPPSDKSQHFTSGLIRVKNVCELT